MNTIIFANTLLINPDLKDNNFNLIRLLLAIAVIYSHCFVIYYGKMIDKDPFMILNQNQMDLGSLAVNSFFIISGFLIFASFENEESRFSFFVKRFLRIYPGFFVAFLISVLILGPLGTSLAYDESETWKLYFANLPIKRFFLDLFTLQTPHVSNCLGSLPLPNMINESLWTIQYELISYLTVPVIGSIKFIQKKWIVLLLFLLSISCFILQEYAQLFLWENYQGKIISHPVYLPRFFSYFFAGGIVFHFKNKLKRKRWIAMIFIICIILSSMFNKILNITLPIAGTYLVFYFAFHPSLKFSNFANNNDFSYGTYLYAWPIQQLLVYFLMPSLDVYKLFFLALLFSLLAGKLSWFLVESYFIKRKSNIISHTITTFKNYKLRTNLFLF